VIGTILNTDAIVHGRLSGAFSARLSAKKSKCNHLSGASYALVSQVYLMLTNSLSGAYALVLLFVRYSKLSGASYALVFLFDNPIVLRKLLELLKRSSSCFAITFTFQSVRAI
jgi:hypothetical protein